MAIPRKYLVDKQAPGFYHCTNRCVRRTFLCGFDKETGQDFSHRKDWLEKRMLSLCELFSIDIYAYAVMDNHYHIVLYLDPKASNSWSNEQVAECWLKLFPSKLDKPENAQQREMKKQSIMADKVLLKKYRKRLGSLSWFMSRLNEPLAKLSNKEDYCTGRFWEGRYTSQALLDEAAVFSCMAYVDLNPVRAKITEKLEESKHTSIKQRIGELQEKENPTKIQENIQVMAGQLNSQQLSMTLQDYIQLVEWTGKNIIHPNKAAMPQHIVSILDNLNLQQNHWLKQIENYGKNYCRVVGSAEKIKAKVELLKVRCLHGISAAKQLYQQPT